MNRRVDLSDLNPEFFRANVFYRPGPDPKKVQFGARDSMNGLLSISIRKGEAQFWSFFVIPSTIICIELKIGDDWAVVVAQLVEWLLPTPEISGSNPNIGKLYLPIVH